MTERESVWRNEQLSGFESARTRLASVGGSESMFDQAVPGQTFRASSALDAARRLSGTYMNDSKLLAREECLG